MAAEDGRRLYEDGQRVMEAVARAPTDGRTPDRANDLVGNGIGPSI